MKEVIPTKNLMSCVLEFYIKKFLAGKTFDKDKANWLGKVFAGKYYIDANFFLNEFLLAEQALTPIMTAAQAGPVPPENTNNTPLVQ